MLIQFGNIEYKLLIILIFPIFLKLRRLNRNNNDIKSRAYIEYCNFISITPCIIFYFIQKISTLKNIKNLFRSSTNNTNKEFINPNNINSLVEKNKQKIEKKSKIKQFFFIVFISFLQICASTISILFINKIDKSLKTNIQPLFQLIFLIIYSMIILRLLIYSHQIISVILICICLIIFLLESIIYQKIKNFEVFKGFLYYLFIQGLYIFSNVLGKKYMNKYVENVYLFLFKYSIISLIPLSIYGGLTYYINIENENYLIFQYFPKVQVRVFILNLFFSFLFELGLWLTMYYFNPCYYFIFETIADFLEVILSNFDTSSIVYSTEQLITFFILYPIILLFICVFNEIIILDFWGLSYNTKKKIMERGENDAINLHDERIMSLIEIKDDNKGNGYIVSL